MIRSLGLTFSQPSARYATGDVLEVAGCPVRLKVDRRAGQPATSSTSPVA